MRSRIRRTLPFGPQFSPEQTPLPDLLEIVAATGGDYSAMVRAIEDRFFLRNGTRSKWGWKKADNTTLALRDYGILDADKATPTVLGQELLALRANETALYEAFAKHILLHRNGLAFVRVIQDELAANREVSLSTLPRVLARRGLNVPATATHISSLKGWLKQAGIFTGGRTSYEVDQQRVEDLLGGLSETEVDAISDLDEIQRAFLRALARFPLGEWHASNEVAHVAEIAYGASFPWKSIKATVLDDCEAAGLVQSQKTTEGRGAKPYLVRTTEKFVAEVVEPLLAAYSDAFGSRIREYLRTSMEAIVDSLASPSKHVKGKALELLAIGLIFTLDLDFVDWRKRGTATGGAEVDVLAESARLVYSRWQIQCKNGRATLEDIAKEVGLAYHLNSNVILVLTTQRFSRDSYAFADSIMHKSNLQIVLLDTRHLQAFAGSRVSVFDALLQQSRHAMRVKRLPEQTEQTLYAPQGESDTEHGSEEDQQPEE